MYDSDSSGDDSTSMSSGFRRLEKHGNRTSSNTKSQKKSPWTKERIQAAREESARKKEEMKKIRKGCENKEISKTKENKKCDDESKRNLMANFGDPHTSVGADEKLDSLDEF